MTLRLPALPALLLAMLLPACAPSSPVPVAPRPSEAQLQDCPEPKLVGDPATATDEQLQLEKVEVAKYAVCERGMFHSLVAWVRGALMGGK